MSILKNIYFISLGSIAFGETIIALQFSFSLSDEDFMSHFFVAPNNSILFQNKLRHHVTELYPGKPKINMLLINDCVEKYPPDIIILSDFLTFEISANDYGLTLDYLRQFGVPILSFDSYEWDSTGYTLDFLPGIKKQVVSRLDEMDGILRPCPLNKPQPPNDRVFCYSFIKQIQNNFYDRGFSTKINLGIPKPEPVVFSATAPWQSPKARTCPRWPFVDSVPMLIQEHLDKTGLPLHWIRVGETETHAVTSHNRITIHDYPALPPAQFDDLLHSSDLLITLNIAATTLVKRISRGGAALLFWNSVNAEKAEDFGNYPHVKIDDVMLESLGDLYPIRPFRMFPLGWFDFLSHVLKDNLYLNTFYQTEILDLQATSKLLECILFTPGLEPDESRENYLESLSDLPTAAECLSRFL